VRNTSRRAPEDGPVTQTLPIVTADDDADLADGQAVPPSPAQKPDNDGEGDDRWAGTMTHDWTAPSETAPAKSSKRKPRLSVAEASGRVPAPLREYLKNVFKCEIDKVRPYEPSKPVKDETPTATEQTQEDPIPGDFSADEGA
jgi:hypothetical protein